MTLTVGDRLLHYEVLARLGAGGMGEVWRAHDSKLDREVAIKVLPHESGGSEVQRERLVREARSASSLIHPNIITIHEINTAGGLDFIVMEYVRGEALAAVLARGRLSAARAIEYGAQICDALGAAHAAGVVHRDLKPGNVMVTESGLIKVLDFGIAKRLLPTSADKERTTIQALTIEGMALGTPAYMSPEQTLGDPVDARSDLFSFGVMLYEMLAGTLPFRGTSNLTLVRQIVHEPAQPLGPAVPEAPDALVAIVERCLAKSPDARYQDASELGAELRQVASLVGTAQASRPKTRPPVTAGQEQARPRPMRAIAVAAGSVLVVLATWFGGPAMAEWARSLRTSQADAPDADASAPELYRRATENLRFYYREGNIDRAIAELELALQKRSTYPQADARLSLAYWRKNALSADGEWQKRARARAESAVTGDPQLAVAHLAQGAAFAITGELDKAAASYERAATLDPANCELLWRTADLAVVRKDTAGAEPLFQRATAACPNEWEAFTRLGSFLYRQGRYEDALQAWLRMRDLVPDHARAFSNLGAVYHQLNRVDEAAAAFQRSLEIAPDDITYSNLGTLLFFQGKYPAALGAFEEAVKRGANNYVRWGNLADAQRMITPGSDTMHESYRTAIQLANDRLTKTPDNVDIRSSLALYLVRDGQTVKALTELDRVLAQKEIVPAALFKAALVAENANQRPRAIDLLGRALAAGYQLREIRQEPDLVKLRADPEYHKLVSRYDK